MSTIPSLQDLLKAGVHFGHRESKRHPKMDPYLFGVRNGVHVVNLEETRKQIEIACAALRDLTKQGKTILFVGTKDAAKPIIREHAARVGMPYVTERWLGGTLTNFAVIGQMIQKYRALLRSRDTGELQQKYTKFEQGQIAQEITRLEVLIGGIAELNKIPDAIVIVDIHEEETAVREAKRKGVTTFAICDSNVDPTLVTYAVPGNDDAVSSIRLLVQVLADAVQEGLDDRAKEMAQAAATETQPATAK
ncbi:30S ribosomal protein S2 [Candidatus Uhrbacteria bacterium]|nr:30S ribosomal protein S2 [Candidatus Uhrbacteria bacterium]